MSARKIPTDVPIASANHGSASIAWTIKAFLAVAFSIWPLPTIDANTAILLHVFLPIPIGLLASRLFYGRVKKIGPQSVGFSPMVASILTAPLLVIAYFIAATTDLVRGTITTEISRALIELVLLFGPTMLIQPLILAVYLRGGVGWKRRFSVIPCAATVACVMLQLFWLYLAAGHGS